MLHQRCQDRTASSSTDQNPPSQQEEEVLKLLQKHARLEEDHKILRAKYYKIKEKKEEEPHSNILIQDKENSGSGGSFDIGKV